MAEEKSRATLVVDTRPAAGAKKTKAVLTVSSVGGTDTNRILTVPHGDVVTLGRDEKCTYRFDEASVSGLHARIVIFGAEYMLADAKSTNGTFVNEVRVGDPVHLHDGDRIRLGAKTVLRFSMLDEEEEQVAENDDTFMKEKMDQPR